MTKPPIDKIKAILFDLDGTLLDTAPDLINALNAVLNKYGFPSSEKNAARAQVSHGATALLKLGFGNKYDEYSALQLRHDLLDYYFDNLVLETEMFDGFEQVLREYQQKNIPWGIVTNKPAFLTVPLMQKMQKKTPILANSSCLIAADTFTTRKPFAIGLLQGAAQLKVAPEHIAYIGDSIRDIQAGHNANMFTIAAEYGYIGSDINLDSWNADQLISSPLELLEFC